MRATLLTATIVSAQIASPMRQLRLDTLPITKFYDTSPLLAGRPGELIRSQAFDEYELPFSVSAIRILYHSRSAAGEDVAASGIVLLPADKRPPAGGWPVIAWAHGAAGVARACAPSLMRNVGHGPFLAMYVSLGYAVVAPDYSGLGTNYRNAFLDGRSNAIDVINSIPAAHAALPQLGARWIVMGEAEGGLTTVAVAEKESEIRDPGYLGAVAISDLFSVKEIFEQSSSGASGSGPSSVMFASLAYGIKTIYPQFQVSDMLTEKALPLYRQLEGMCSPARTTLELSPADLARPGWQRNSFVRQYLDRNELGNTRMPRPILVISGDADRITAGGITAQAVARLCKQGDQVLWKRYSDFDPGSVIGGSVRDQMTWIEARFAGRPTQTNCP